MEVEGQQGTCGSWVLAMLALPISISSSSVSLLLSSNQQQFSFEVLSLASTHHPTWDHLAPVTLQELTSRWMLPGVQQSRQPRLVSYLLSDPHVLFLGHGAFAFAFGVSWVCFLCCHPQLPCWGIKGVLQGLLSPLGEVSHRQDSLTFFSPPPTLCSLTGFSLWDNTDGYKGLLAAAKEKRRP